MSKTEQDIREFLSSNPRRRTPDDPGFSEAREVPADPSLVSAIQERRGKAKSEQDIRDLLRREKARGRASSLDEGIRNIPRIVRGALGTLAKGVTLGASDEIRGGVEAVGALVPGGRSSGEAFREGTDAERKITEEFSEEHPVASTFLEVTGAAAPTLLAGPAALGVRGTAGAAGRVSLGRLGVLGAAEGAFAGAANAEGGLEERGTSAAVGAGLGGAAGVGGPALARATSAAGRRFLDVSGLRPKGGGQSGVVDRAAERAGISSIDDRADEAIASKLPTGEAFDEAREALQGSSRLSLMDADPNVADLGRAARQVPGSTRRQIPDFLARRVATQEDKILDDALRLTGVTDNPNVFELTEEIVTRRSESAAEAYGAIRDRVVDNPAVGRFLKRPSFRRAYAVAERIAGDAGEALPPLDALINEAGELQQPLTLGVLDQIKRGLDDILHVGKRSSLEAGGLGPTGARMVRDAKNDFIGLLDEAIPEYAAARSAFAGESAMLEALEEGQRLFKMRPAEAERLLRDMGDSEREMFVRGGMDALRDQIEAASASFDATKRRPLREATRDRRLLRLLFPDEEAFGQFERTLAEEARIATTNRKVTGGSDTVDKAVGLADFLGISPFSVRGLGKSVLGDAERQLVQEASEALVPKLTATGPEALDFLDRLNRLRETQGGGRATRELLTAGVPAAAIAGAAGPQVAQLLFAERANQQSGREDRGR